MIQVHERARQARLYYGDLNYYRYLRTLKLQNKLTDPGTEAKEASALTIQKYWRGYTAKRDFKEREKQRRLIMGMTQPSRISKEEIEKFKRNIEKRRELREQKYKEYIQANLDEKARVLRVIGPGLMEDIGDEIREWFHDWYTIAKCFDKYPSEEQGGTILVVRGETITPEEYMKAKEKKQKDKKKSPADKKKEKEEKAKAKKAAKDKLKKEKAKARKEAMAAKRKEKRGEYELEFGDTPTSKMFEDGFNEEELLWSDRPYSDNPEAKPYMDMITEEKCYEMQMELRPQVDELMR